MPEILIISGGAREGRRGAEPPQKLSEPPQNFLKNL